jgi:hypothetical protein
MIQITWAGRTLEVRRLVLGRRLSPPLAETFDDLAARCGLTVAAEPASWLPGDLRIACGGPQPAEGQESVGHVRLGELGAVLGLLHEAAAFSGVHRHHDGSRA